MFINPNWDQRLPPYSDCSFGHSLPCCSGKFHSFNTPNPNHASCFCHTCPHSPQLNLQLIPFNRICIYARLSGTHTQSDLPWLTMFSPVPVPACLPALPFVLPSRYRPDLVSISPVHLIPISWLRYTSPTPSLGHGSVCYIIFSLSFLECLWVHPSWADLFISIKLCCILLLLIHRLLSGNIFNIVFPLWIRRVFFVFLYFEQCSCKTSVPQINSCVIQSIIFTQCE